MDAVPRNTPAMLAKIDTLRNSFIKRFENIVAHAAIQDASRNATALTTYQLRTETAGLIRTTEDILTFSRQLQDLWLFGQLKTLHTDEPENQRQTEDVQAIAGLLAQIANADQSEMAKTTESKEIKDEPQNGDLHMTTDP